MILQYPLEADSSPWLSRPKMSSWMPGCSPRLSRVSVVIRMLLEGMATEPYTTWSRLSCSHYKHVCTHNNWCALPPLSWMGYGQKNEMSAQNIPKAIHTTYHRSYIFQAVVLTTFLEMPYCLWLHRKIIAVLIVTSRNIGSGDDKAISWHIPDFFSLEL